MAARKKILLVDDDNVVVAYLSHRLGLHYEMTATTNPRAALRMARAQRPDLILCDIDMPGMSGGELTFALAQDAKVSHIPVLYLTAMVSPEEVQDLEGILGGRPGISKRAPLPELKTRIDQMTA